MATTFATGPDDRPIASQQGTPASSGEFPVHYQWLGSGRWGVEAIAGLDDLPAKGAMLVVAGPKVRGGTGGPSRIIALV